ncbi:cell division protein ZapB [Pseudodesulfovibrio senegalensis]|jgi:cell division protein ZapB|uniref:Cell division protein ZapB n=1 Tax=Pseudodesulfovibrio senegalensis TaxID=1721087 RepID=A0A6N6N458_9BACT|nr:cell division protein ZapB [Pseudodesulfovibrio senegalensis]KAB1441873.1 cell division protein ZapB [Pseudodesulfovibrio senegalensis]
MDMVDRLESRFEALVQKIQELKEENRRLTETLEQERSTKGDATQRIEALLARIEGELE